jgi:hypothetical protein
MEAIFHLPYSEYEAISQFGETFKKMGGYGIFIPTSRQQQGIDFLVLNNRNQCTLRVQVKSSRAYVWDSPPYQRFWYNNFAKQYKPGAADLYAFTALYPIYKIGTPVRSRRFWQTAILVFTDNEMGKLLPRIKNKSGKADRFFQFGFDSLKDIRVTRGRLAGMDLSPLLLKNRIGILKKKLG